ncbi:MAG: hypothetical protein O2973_02585 [Gemmatimonadetes bacterium]|nr:hypothetical protein [Gemmatimonadota bacterium]
MDSTMMRRGLAGLITLSVTAAALHAQEPDARWRAWTGCWTTTSSTITSRGTVCVVPATGTSAVEIISVVGSTVVDRVRVEADGMPHEFSRARCTGTETARWSETGTRVYTSEAMTCPGGVTRHVNGVMSFSPQYEWLDVRGVSSGQATGVAVARYQALLDTAGLPAAVMPALSLRGPAASNAVLAASSPLTLADIADVATSVDSGVAATWLTERTEGVKVSIDAKNLIALADAGVASSVIDVLVAIAHPAVFSLDANTRDAAFRERTTTNRTIGMSSDRYGRAMNDGWYTGGYLYDPYYLYGMYSPYSYGYQNSAFGYGYSSPFYSPYYGYYPGSRPIVIVNRSSDNGGGIGGGIGGSGGSSGGRVVKGKGYTSGSSSGSSGGASTQSSGSSGSSSSGSSSSGSSSSAGSSSGSSGSTRTAVRKPPADQ